MKTLQVGRAQFQVRYLPLLQSCDSPALHQKQDPDQVRCSVSLDLFQTFLSAIEGQDINITSDNFPILSELSAEFGFATLLTKLEAFSHSSELQLRQLKVTVKEQAVAREDFSSRLSVLEKLLKKEVRFRCGCSVLFGTNDCGSESEEERLSERLGLSLLRLLAESGNHDAEYEYGRNLLEGRGCEQHIEEGVDFLRRAAESGHSFGEAWYGRCLEAGYGVRRNEIEAAEYYSRSAASGNSYGEFLHGRSYGRGIGHIFHLKIAAGYFRQSAEHGNMSGQYMLGLCYEFGMGVARDMEQAQKYYDLSRLQEDVGWEHRVGFSLECENCCDDNLFRLDEYYHL
jgi:hypothetical protein